MHVKTKLLVGSLFLIVFIIGADSFIIAPLLPAIEQSFQITVNQAALAVAIYAVCYSFGAPLFGPLGDRYPRKQLLLLGISIFLVGSVLCAVAPTIIIFDSCRVLAGLGAALTLPNVWALIGQRFQGPQLNLVMGITMSALSLSIAIGVPLGTGVAQLANWHWAFGMSAGLTLLALIGIWWGVPAVPVSDKRPTHYLGNYRAVWQSARTRWTLMVTLIWMTGFYLVYTFLGTYATRQFHLTTLQVGELFSLYGFSNFIASFLSGWLVHRLGTGPAVCWFGGLSAILVAGMAVGRLNLIVLSGLLMLLALAQGLGVTALNTMVVTLLPTQRSTVTAFNSSFLYLGLTISASFGSLLYTTIGFGGVCISAAIALGLATGLANVVRTAKD
ncbi:MFS transporter [Lactiplantibacillus daowaiensis]|uniref:MFS transporter n=1 Tax=Lactiplantibacillus daowaiensis TaxID=2559918 RepID=A0ABW1S2N4_9LACO